MLYDKIRNALLAAAGIAAMAAAAADFPVVEKTGKAIQSAIDAAHAAGGGRVVLDEGTYPSGTLYLKSHVELHLKKGATILGAGSPDGYDDVDDPRIGQKPENSTKVFIACIDSEDVAITGEGTIDGQGVKFYDTTTMRGKFFAKPPRPRTRMVEFFKCRNILFEGVLFKDSPGWTFWIRDCENVTVSRIRIYGDQRMINNDGIDIDGCRHVRIGESDFKTGDDCVVMRAMRLQGKSMTCEDMVVSNCVLDSACQGIRLSCPSDDLIKDGLFKNLTFRGRNGVQSAHPRRYLAPWCQGHARMQNMLFEDCTFDNWGSPISFWVEPGITLREFGNVTFRNIKIRADRPIQLKGCAESVLRNIRFENVEGTVSAAQPIEMQSVENVTFDNFRITSGKGVPAQFDRGKSDSWESKR